MQTFHGEVGGGGSPGSLPMWNAQVTWAHTCKIQIVVKIARSSCSFEVSRKEQTEGRAKIWCVVASFSSKWSVLNEVFSGLWALSPLYFQMEVTIASRVAHLAKSLNSLDPIWPPAFASRLASMSRLSRLSRPEGTNTTAAIDDVSQIKYTPSARDHRSDTPGPQHVKIRSQMSRTRGHYPVPPDRNLTGTRRV